MTQLTQAQYVELKGTKCPFCGGGPLRGGDFGVGEGTAWQEITCQRCSFSYTDEYKLVGYSTECG